MYRDVVASLATRHGKRAALGPPLRRHLGLRLRVPPVDTDALGTFTGEVERPGPAPQVVVAKARLGMDAADCPVGVASEGSFGPHPAVPWHSLQVEYVVLLDDRLGLVVLETASSVAGNHADLLTDGTDRGELLAFARRTGTPGHALTVVPAVPAPGAPVLPAKGIVTVRSLLAAVAAAGAASRDGRARVAADLRAHHNPRRMAVIAEAGVRLARRMATACPGCGAPGFGPVAARPGLPCSACRTETDLVAERVSGCGLCTYQRAERVRPFAADPASCPSCNP
ncbi:DUF6671 family protein [Micromonospora sp. BQ11]|uniref:DUF6671 family protein n=1 Tax=Micromonospora sp. BQ11 TaxID=3452212 RepID=UPI003F889ADD